MLALLGGCDPFHTRFDDVEPARKYTAATLTDAPDDVDNLLVMTWNLKFGGGRIEFFFECNGNRYLMSQAEVLANLQGIAAQIQEVQPDLLLLQEVDVEAKRSAYVDQLQWLLNHTDLNYGAYASQWKADYVPSDGIGRINSGNATLSRWPIQRARRIGLPLIDEQDAVSRYFYLRRNILDAHIRVPGLDDLRVLNTHFSAFATDDTKRRQVESLNERLQRIEGSGASFVVGGDLNLLPPGSPQLTDFADTLDCANDRFDGSDYTGQEDWLQPLYDAWTPAMSLSHYAVDPVSWYTFTGDPETFWTRKLDYLFTNEAFVLGTAFTWQEETAERPTLLLSDHAPLSARLETP